VTIYLKPFQEEELLKPYRKINRKAAPSSNSNLVRKDPSSIALLELAKRVACNQIQLS